MNSKKTRYVIHLKVEYYEPKKKDKKNDIETGQKDCMAAARKAFSLALKEASMDKEILVSKDECSLSAWGTAVFVDVNEEKFPELRTFLCTLDIVDIIEPDYGASEEKKVEKESKKKDLGRFLK